MDWWAKLYLYEIEFANGTIVKQAEDGRRIEEFVREHGQAKEIRLVPQDEDLRAHAVRIPVGTRPVYFRRNEIAVGHTGKGLRFCIGWTQDNDTPRSMLFISVSARTGDVTLMQPETYRGQ